MSKLDPKDLETLRVLSRLHRATYAHRMTWTGEGHRERLLKMVRLGYASRSRLSKPNGFYFYSITDAGRVALAQAEEVQQ